MQLNETITQNVINKICFAFNIFSFFKSKRELSGITIFNNVFRSSEGKYNYAAELEIFKQTPSNA